MLLLMFQRPYDFPVIRWCWRKKKEKKKRPDIFFEIPEKLLRN